MQEILERAKKDKKKYYKTYIKFKNLIENKCKNTYEYQSLIIKLAKILEI